MTLDLRYFAHGNNLAHKRRVASRSLLKVLDAIEPDYKDLIRAIAFRRRDWLRCAVRKLNAYTAVLKCVEKQDNFFNWRGDFASSLLPEFLVRIVYRALREAGVEPLFSTRNSIVDITLSGYRDGGWTVRRKNQDLCIGLRTDVINIGDERLEFVVPIVAIEAKTNIDINKLNGLDFSADRLKRTFPAARYFLLTETLDFDLRKNYSGSIDEVFVLRKQKRSESRRDKADYCPDVFESFVEEVAHYVSRADTTRKHVYERLESGRLINV